MYLNFFDMTQEPFDITPNPAFLFLSPSHKEALASIIYGIEDRKGFVAIIGEVGTGKTTIVRAYLERSNRQKVKPIYIFNSDVSFEDLLKTIFRELGIAVPSDTLYVLVRHLHEVLIEEYKQGHNIVLIVDEAQNMPVQTLEQLRMLSNLETNKDKLMQIVLVGQSELEDKLNLGELRQLKQRIAIRTTIRPLTKKESLAYIQHRLSQVTLRDHRVFTRGARKHIVRDARGIPRVLNILCDNALIAAYGYQKRPISSKIAKEVIADYRGKQRSRSFMRRFAPAAAVILAAALFMIAPHRDSLFARVKDTYMSRARQASTFTSKTQEDIASLREGAESSETREILPALESEAPTVDQVDDLAFGNGRLSSESALWSQLGVATTEEATAIAFAQDTLSSSFAARSPAAATEEALASARTGEASPALSNIPAEISGQILIHQQGTNRLPGDVKSAYPVKRLVKEGDNLTGLCVDVYGYTNSDLIHLIKQNNRNIKDANLILTGDHILFPDPIFDRAKKEVREATGALRLNGDDFAFRKTISHD